MKKQIITSLLLTGICFALSAQQVTTAMLIGKWKVVGIREDDKWETLNNLKSFEAMLYRSELKDNPKIKFSAADSAEMHEEAKMLYALLADLHFIFTADGNFEMTSAGMPPESLNKGTFDLVTDNTMEIEREGQLSVMTLNMPDPNTLYCFDGIDEIGLDFMLKRQP